MALDCTWIGAGSTQSYAADGNWSGGAPQAAEEAGILTGTSLITDGMDQSAINLTSWTVGYDFEGQIGTPSSPLKLGTVTSLTVNAPHAHVNLWPATATSMYVRGAGADTYACHIVNGTVTNLYVLNAGHVRIGASATVTNLYVIQQSSADSCHVEIESGATITNAHMSGGHVECSAAIATGLTVWGGLWEQDDGNTASVTTYGGTVRLNASGHTHTVLHCWGGTIDGTETSYEQTVTNANVWPAGRLLLNSQTVLTNDIAIYGGEYRGPDGTTINIPVFI